MSGRGIAGPGTGPSLSWFGIVRLGLVQTALGAVVVLTTSAINRVMVIELALPATLPGLLVGFHYGIQMLRPRLGYGSDKGGRRTPWILSGMAALGAGGVLAAIGTTLMTGPVIPALALLVLAFALIGLGVGAAGTSLLVLLAERSAPHRRAAAASIAWILMILGFVVTTAVAGGFLDPYSPGRLVAVASVVSLAACVLAGLAVWGVETDAPRAAPAPGKPPMPPFRVALREVWAEPVARHFAIFVFVSMLGYSAQDLILEPFAGAVFGLSLGESTRLTSVQNSGVLLGMVLVAGLGWWLGRNGGAARTQAILRSLTIAGCSAAALAMSALAVGGFLAEVWPLQISFAALGFANGVFAAAAIASMMHLVGQGTSRREGVRMGMFGAAQAVAFGAGGLAGTVAYDIAQLALAWPVASYAVVFALDALLFAWAAWLAGSIGRPRQIRSSSLEAALAAR